MVDVVGDLTSLVQQYADNGGVQVYLKTNYGPEVPLYTGSASDGGQRSTLMDLVGLKAQIIVRNNKGGTVAKYGPDSPTDWVRVSVLVGVLALLGFVLVRGVLK